MKESEIRSIGWLTHTKGIRLVACGSFGTLFAVIPYDEFQEIRGDDEKMKKKFCEEYNK